MLNILIVYRWNSGSAKGSKEENSVDSPYGGIIRIRCYGYNLSLGNRLGTPLSYLAKVAHNAEMAKHFTPFFTRNAGMYSLFRFYSLTLHQYNSKKHATRHCHQRTEDT